MLKKLKVAFECWLYRVRYNPVEGICYVMGLMCLCMLIWALFFAKK